MTVKFLSKSAENKINAKMLIMGAVVLAAVGLAGYFAYENQRIRSNPQSLVQADQSRLIDKVGKLIDLPKDEQPSIATVSDKNKLKEQAFFKNAQNGDTLLIYTNARKAILYREKDNKVIEVAPIAIDTAAQPTGTQPAKTDDKQE